MHFHIFGSLALLLIYRDWRPIVAAAGFIAVHHLVFTALQLYEIPVFGGAILLFGYGCSWGIFLVHAAFVVFETAFLVYYAYLMQKEQEFSAQLVNAVSEVQRSHDLSIRVKSSEENEVAIAFNSMMMDFEHLIKDLHKTTDSLAHMSTELAESSSATSGAIGSQHDQIEDAVNAMAEMTVAIQDVAKNAGDAASVTQQADAQARNGESVVDRAISKTGALVDSMNEANQSIEELSSKAQAIGSVVDVIQDISEQTNLLALNAAIEAARAGEHGRGFAVVSEEVRVLAQRTRKSTEEIQGIIRALQSGTEDVVDLINKGRDASLETSEEISGAGSALKSITDSVSRINDINTLNASSAEEQSVTSQSVSDNIRRISDISGGSVKNIEQNQVAANRLRELSDALQDTVRKYRSSAVTA